MTLDALLRGSPELAAYVEHMPEEVRGRVTLRTYPAHSLILQKNDALTAFGILCRGRLRVVSEFENGNIFNIERKKAVAFIGEVPLLAGMTLSPVSIETLTECLVLELSLEDFRLWVGQDVGFLNVLARSISNRYCTAVDNRGAQLFCPVRYLVLKYLLEQSGEGFARGESRVVLHQTRQEIGEALCLTVKTLNRNVAALREDGLIGIEKGKISITAPQRRQICAAAAVYLRQSKRRKNGGT